MTQTIFEEFTDLRRQLLNAGQMPTRVTFNSPGYLAASMSRPWDRVNINQETRTYCGLPYDVRPEQQGRVALHTDGAVIPKPVTFRVDHLDPRATTMELAGQALSKAQLSDLLQAWVDAHPNEQPVTDMLIDWIQTHGRFE